MVIKYYSLAYFQDEEERLIHRKYRSNQEKIDIFVKNAAFLDKSLKWFKSGSLILLTNKPQYLENSFKRIGYRLDYETLNFKLNIPPGIPYYSSHYKIDTFEYISTQNNANYYILLDNDVFQLNAYSEIFQNIVYNHIPITYLRPIHNKTVDALNFINDQKNILPIIMWTGGEIWGGPTNYFKDLYQESLSIINEYFNSLKLNKFHIGDEAITSLALSKLWVRKYQFLDISYYDIITRFSGMIENRNFDEDKFTFYHLPVDKLWVYNLNIEKINDPESFKIKYIKHLMLYKRLFKFKSFIDKIYLRPINKWK